MKPKLVLPEADELVLIEAPELEKIKEEKIEKFKLFLNQQVALYEKQEKENFELERSQLVVNLSPIEKQYLKEYLEDLSVKITITSYQCPELELALKKIYELL